MDNLQEDNCLKTVFCSSSQVYELADRLARQSFALNEISTNAAIAAGHAGSEGRVFIEIAKQIGVISTLLVDRVNKVRDRSSVMSNQSLHCTVIEARRVKFLQALKLIESDSGRVPVRRIADELATAISDALDELEVHVAGIKPERGAIKLVIERIWSIIINLRISAETVPPAEAVFFVSISQSLDSLAKDCEELLEHLSRTIESIETILCTQCACLRGVKKHAA